MTVFFSRLSYSFGNEDWNTERKALQIKPQDRVLCITASGDRPLNLLTNPCQEIVCVDANQIQNHLLVLKKSAMQLLEYEEYMSFLGAQAGSERQKTFERLSNEMDKEAKCFWNKNKKIISKGVLYQGAVERFVKKASRVIGFFRRYKLKKLFDMDDLDEQRRFINEQWDQPKWRKTFEMLLNHPLIMKIMLKDPGLYAHVNPGIKPGTYIYERMNASLKRCLARENPLVSLMLKGEVSKEAFPPYLTHEGFKAIKTRLDRLSPQTANVIDYLETSPPESFDCFSLSDVASYLHKEDFVRLLKAIVRTAKPGARFSIRQLMSIHLIPEDLQSNFQRETELENELEKEDRCFVYRFMVGTVSK